MKSKYIFNAQFKTPNSFVAYCINSNLSHIHQPLQWYMTSINVHVTLICLNASPNCRHFMYMCMQQATKPFRCLGVLDCALNIYFDLMVKILEIFRHILPHLSYIITQESRKSIGNFLRYNYFLPQVSFEQFCCWQLMSEKYQNWRLLLRCWLMSHD